MAKARFDLDGNVGVITIDNPPLNLVGPELIADLKNVIGQVEQSEIRAMLMRAEGDNFSAGAQVDEMFQNKSQQEALELLKDVGALLERYEKLPFPTVAAVQGMCLAGGLEMALACDMIWAADNSQLGLIEAVIGAIPFGGGTQRLAQRAGSARACEIVMGHGMYDAPTFERWNIINRILPADELHEKSLRFVHRLATGATLAHGVTKRLLREYQNNGLAASDALLPEAASELFETQDMQNGIVSLLENGPGQATFNNR